MTALVIAEHDNKELKVSTQNTISAATKLDSDIHVLVAGTECNAVAEEELLVKELQKFCMLIQKSMKIF